MDSAAVVVGLALVLALQIAIHLRIAGIPGRVAALKAAGEGRARLDGDALQEALARRLNLLVRGIQGYHDQIAEDFRARIAAGEQRARRIEEQRAEAAGLTTELRALAREMAGVSAELRTLEGDLAELACAAAEARRAPAPEAPKAATADDPDERKTIEMAPPRSCAPAPVRAQPAANDVADDEGWDDPEEKTKLFAKDDAPNVLVAAREPRAGASRHALRPPPIVEEDDDAMERPSILPEARPS